MTDREAIVDLITRLFVGTDTRDWTAVRDCFAPAVLFDMTSMSGGSPATMTPQQISDIWDKGLKPMQSIHHQAGNFRVRVDGDEADAFCYATAWHYRPTASGRNTRVLVGSYDFHVICADNAWKIDRFKFNLKFIDGNAELEKG